MTEQQCMEGCKPREAAWLNKLAACDNVKNVTNS